MEADSSPSIEKMTCLECGGKDTFIQEKGEIICNNCGLIISERNIDNFNIGLRFFTSEEIEKKLTTGPPQTIFSNLNQSTIIKINHIRNPDLKRAAKKDKLIEWNEKNLLISGNEIKRITASLRLPRYVKDMAMTLYKRYLKDNMLSGRSINGMVAACIFYVCRVKQISRSLKEISNKANLKHENSKEIYNCYKTLIKELNLKTPPPDPILFVPRFISELKLDFKVESPTIKIIRSFTSRSCSTGKDPRVIAASALYLVCKMINITISQKEVAKVAQITNISLCKRYKEILDLLFLKNRRKI
ncbi:MAG: transcription initiation factor IIB family protein [Promethearchaeota archaeon]